MYKDAHVYIVPTKNLMQGYSALSVITPGITDVDILVSSVCEACSSVVGIEVTRAVRDVTMNGKEIKAGDYIAISGGEITAVGVSAEDTCVDSLGAVDMDEYEIITVFVGKDVDGERRVKLTEMIEDAYPDCTVEFYEGGQEIYDYLIAVE